MPEEVAVEGLAGDGGRGGEVVGGREGVDFGEAELLALDEHIEQLHVEIDQLQQKLADAKARQKAMQMRSQTVESRIKVKRQIQREALDDAFTRFDRYERRMDDLEGQVEAMDIGRGDKSQLASEIDALAEDEKLNEELAQLKAEMAAAEKTG